MLSPQKFFTGVKRHGFLGTAEKVRDRLVNIVLRAIKRGKRGVVRLVVKPVVFAGDTLYSRKAFTFGTLSAQRIGHFAADLGLQIASQASANRSAKRARLDVRVIDPKEPVSNDFLMSIVDRAFWLTPKLWFLFSILRSSGIRRPWLIDPDASDNRDKFGMLQSGDGRYPFSATEDEIGHRFLESIGWTRGQSFVCLLVRDAQYLDVTPGLRPSDVNKSWEYHGYRNSDITTYVAASRWLAEQGAIVLRMGKSMARPFPAEHPNIVDYAFHADRSDFLDVWLHANCNLCITTGTGPDVISAVHLRPLLFVNFLPIIAKWSWANAVTAPKRLVWRSSGRRLSFEESAAQIWLRSDQYDSNGVEVRDLDAYALQEIVAEAWRRLDGSWVDNLGDTRRSAAALAALEARPEYTNWHGYRHPDARFSSVWLRQLESELNTEDRPKDT